MPYSAQDTVERVNLTINKTVVDPWFPKNPHARDLDRTGYLRLFNQHSTTSPQTLPHWQDSTSMALPLPIPGYNVLV